MENNKAYLQKIHWVFLIGLAIALLDTLCQQWLRTHTTPVKTSVILEGVHITGLFASLGIITAKWKESLIGCALSALFPVLDLFVTERSLDFSLQILLFILAKGPLVVFFGLLFGWTKNLVTAWFLLFIAFLVMTFGFYAPYGFSEVIEFFRHDYRESENYREVFRVIFPTAAFTCKIICLCEIMNFLAGRKNARKTTLLNPGNDYPKWQSMITFWSLKIMFIGILFGAGEFINTYLSFFSRIDFHNEPGYMKFLFIYKVIELLLIIPLAVLFAWYLRKFLLEFFITYNISSRFLYWFCLLPVVGFIAFLVLLVERGKQDRPTDKINTIGQLANNPSTGVTAIFIVGYVIRFIFQVQTGDTVFIISLILDVLLFLWFIYELTGFYVTLGLNFLLLLSGIIWILFAGSPKDTPLSLLFSIVLYSLMQILLILPVYHFDKFEYTLPEDPGPEQPRESHLFG